MKTKPTYQELERELKILKKKDKSKILLDLAGVIFVAIDTNGIVTLVNKKTSEIFGYEEKEMLGKNWFENFIPKRVKNEVLQVSKKLLSGEIDTDEYYENPILTKSGEERLIYWHNAPIKDEKGNITGHLSSGEDITERKKAKKVLEESEENYRLLTEAMQDVVIRITSSGKLLYVSPAIKEFGGYIPEEEIGNHISKYFSKKTDLLRALKLIAEVAITHKSGSFEFMLKQKNKTPLPVELTYVPLIKAGKVYAIQMVLRDITDRKKAEQKLKESEEHLRDLNATKDKFFSIIAHDLKSPFNSMLGFSELLINNFDEYDVQQHKELIDIIHRGVKNTHKLLENLLLWSRTQSGTIEFYPETENLYLLSIETIEPLSQSAKNKSITIKNEIPQDIFIKADKNMLLTILRNLISNAVKFTLKGGEIAIGARTVTNENNQNYTEISVKDSGVGISPEIQSRLFKIAENVSTKGTENEVGTGLGLILCKEFIEKHGGEIWVESEVGKGSKFIFTMQTSN